MREVGKSLRAGCACGALISGMLLGYFLRAGNLGPGLVGYFATSGKHSSSAGSDREAGENQQARPRRREADGISFSRAQWSKLVRNPKLGAVGLLEILDATNRAEKSVPILNDIPLIGRLFERRATPDLTTHAEFFGWDELRTREVRSALTIFGDRLAEAEKTGVRVEYPEGGGVRFDFSESQPMRVKVTRELKEKLGKILGRHDAERFALLTGMEGLAKDLPVVFEIKDPPATDILLSNPDTPDAAPEEVYQHQDGQLSSQPEPDPRVRHLGIEIEWNRATPKLKFPATQ